MNDEFDLLNGSYSALDIEDYFECIIENHETIADNSPPQIYTNKIKTRIAFNIKTDYEIELFSSETMSLLKITNKDVDQDRDGEMCQN